MKPLEAMRRLRTVRDLIAHCQPLPPDHRGWLVLAINQRLSDPQASLDNLLGLRQWGGTPGLSHIPARDAAIRDFAATLPGREAAKVRVLARCLRERNPKVIHLFEFDKPPPTSISQLKRILSGRTSSARENSLPAASTWLS